MGNSTDGNDDDVIDTRDTADIVVVRYGSANENYLYMCDRAAGREHGHARAHVSALTDPALGDNDVNGVAASIAFDFLADGTTEAMCADEQRLHVYDEGGLPLMETTRRSGTNVRYPVVVDVDNNGAAEIVVVSQSVKGEQPPLQVFSDREVAGFPHDVSGISTPTTSP